MSTPRRPPTTVTHESGLQFTADIRGHRLLVDQPAGAGGADAAPTPLELLGAGLGTCVALYVQQFCAARDLPHEGFRVEVESRSEQGRIAGYEVRVLMPEPLPPDAAALLDRVARSCPAHKTLVHGAEVDVRVEVPAGTT